MAKEKKEKGPGARKKAGRRPRGHKRGKREAGEEKPVLQQVEERLDEERELSDDEALDLAEKILTAQENQEKRRDKVGIEWANKLGHKLEARTGRNSAYYKEQLEQSEQLPSLEELDAIADRFDEASLDTDGRIPVDLFDDYRRILALAAKKRDGIHEILQDQKETDRFTKKRREVRNKIETTLRGRLNFTKIGEKFLSPEETDIDEYNRQDVADYLAQPVRRTPGELEKVRARLEGIKTGLEQQMEKSGGSNRLAEGARNHADRLITLINERMAEPEPTEGSTNLGNALNKSAARTADTSGRRRVFEREEAVGSDPGTNPMPGMPGAKETQAEILEGSLEARIDELNRTADELLREPMSLTVLRRLLDTGGEIAYILNRRIGLFEKEGESEKLADLRKKIISEINFLGKLERKDPRLRNILHESRFINAFETETTITDDEWLDIVKKWLSHKHPEVRDDFLGLFGEELALGGAGQEGVDTKTEAEPEAKPEEISTASEFSAEYKGHIEQLSAAQREAREKVRSLKRRFENAGNRVTSADVQELIQLEGQAYYVTWSGVRALEQQQEKRHLRNRYERFPLTKALESELGGDTGKRLANIITATLDTIQRRAMESGGNFDKPLVSDKDLEKIADYQELMRPGESVAERRVSELEAKLAETGEGGEAEDAELEQIDWETLSVEQVEQAARDDFARAQIHDSNEQKSDGRSIEQMYEYVANRIDYEMYEIEKNSPEMSPKRRQAELAILKARKGLANVKSKRWQMAARFTRLDKNTSDPSRRAKMLEGIKMIEEDIGVYEERIKEMERALRNLVPEAPGLAETQVTEPDPDATPTVELNRSEIEEKLREEARRAARGRDEEDKK